eukprot:7284350-Prymnesium_polylepis.1
MLAANATSRTQSECSGSSASASHSPFSSLNLHSLTMLSQPPLARRMIGAASAAPDSVTPPVTIGANDTALTPVLCAVGMSFAPHESSWLLRRV